MNESIYIEYDSKYESGDRPLEYSEFIDLLNEHVRGLLKGTYLTSHPRFTTERVKKSGAVYFFGHENSFSASFEISYLLLKHHKIKPEEVNNIITMWHSEDEETRQLVFAICLKKYNELLKERTNKQ